MYTEIKYLNLLSVRLEKFKRKSEFLWNFRCPICGDSKKNKNKARGFMFQLKGKLLYKCHNCEVSLPFDKFLQDLDPELYKEYKMEKFKDTDKGRKEKEVTKKLQQKPKFEVNPLANLVPLEELNTSHPARMYILNRQLPLNDLYWTDRFCEFVNSVKPNTFEEPKEHEGRIVIPFKDKEGHCFGFQGRAIRTHTIRYITILLEERPKIFGLNHVKTNRRVYVTEGPFDSLLLENSVAMAGADISVCRDLLGDDVVFVYDNEPRNGPITQRMSKHISRGDSVVIWPNEIKEKDINEMVLAGYPVQSIVFSNTYSGLTAKLKFNEWRK